MDESITAAAVIAPIVVATVQAARISFEIPSRIAPFMALLLGMGLAFIAPPVLDARSELLTGLLAGLAASGLYSGAKSLSGR